MPRIATRLAGPIAASTAATTLFTVAAAEKNIVRHIHVSNPSAGALTITMSIGASAAGTRIFDGYSIPANSVFDHYCYYVLDAAEIFQALASATNLVFTIDGDRSVLG